MTGGMGEVEYSNENAERDVKGVKGKRSLFQDQGVLGMKKMKL